MKFAIFAKCFRRKSEMGIYGTSKNVLKENILNSIFNN